MTDHQKEDITLSNAPVCSSAKYIDIEDIRIANKNIIDVTISSSLRFKKAFFMLSKASTYLVILNILASLNKRNILINVILTVQNDK